MLYIIDGKYYMLRNREYVQADVELNNNEIHIKPNRNNTIETNSNIKVTSISIEDVIKKLKKEDSSNDSKNNKHKYNI